MNIDHLVYATPDLESGIREVEKLLGVRPKAGGRHPGLGTANALISLNDEIYLEIIGPDPDRRDVEKPRLFGINRLTEPRLVTWCVRSNDLESVVKNANAADVPVGSILSAKRERPDGVTLTWNFTDPSLFPESGIIPFFIDWGVSPHPSQDAPYGGALISFRAKHPEPERVGTILQLLNLDLPVVSADTASLIATIQTFGGVIELT